MNFLLVVLVAGNVAAAEVSTETHKMAARPALSAELERVKSFAGTWKGTASDGKNEFPAVVTYRVTSGGSAVEEILDPGTPHEMITVYHDRAGKLALTHFCALGNQPRMQLARLEGRTLTFELSDGNDLDPARDLHMHALSLTVTDDGQMTADWTSFDHGQKASTMRFQLKKEGWKDAPPVPAANAVPPNQRK